MSLDVLIGRRVRMAREMSGVTVETMASAIGLTPDLMQAAETGRQRISAKSLFRISKLLNLELRWFFDTDMKDSLPLDCSNHREMHFSGEYPSILHNLRLNKTLEDLCKAANQVGAGKYKTNKVA